MHLLYGKPLADRILDDLKTRIREEGIIPGLAVILVGDDPASHLYVDLKEKAALALGMRFEKYVFPKEVKQKEVSDQIRDLNKNGAIHGIIVQLPLPSHLDQTSLVEAILPEKDADGFHSETVRRFFSGEQGMQPVFPRAICHLIQSVGEKLEGEKAIAVVNSELFGRVMEQSFLNMQLQPAIVRCSDITHEQSSLGETKVVVTACGKSRMIYGNMFQSGVIVVDGGITHHDRKIVGDVALESVIEHEGWITPVPGGVGPLTIAMLLSRTVELSLRQRGR